MHILILWCWVRNSKQFLFILVWHNTNAMPISDCNCDNGIDYWINDWSRNFSGTNMVPESLIGLFYTQNIRPRESCNKMSQTPLRRVSSDDVELYHIKLVSKRFSNIDMSEGKEKLQQIHIMEPPNMSFDLLSWNLREAFPLTEKSIFQSGHSFLQVPGQY